MGAISITNRLGNFNYVLFSTMGLRSAIYSSGGAPRCRVSAVPRESYFNIMCLS